MIAVSVQCLMNFVVFEQIISVQFGEYVYRKEDIKKREGVGDSLNFTEKLGLTLYKVGKRQKIESYNI